MDIVTAPNQNPQPDLARTEAIRKSTAKLKQLETTVITSTPTVSPPIQATLRPSMTLIAVPKMESLRAVCSGCGTKASCTCNLPYIPAREYAAKVITDNPQKSNRAIAAASGISEATIRRARGASKDAPARRIGKDGKKYFATRSTSTTIASTANATDSSVDALKLLLKLVVESRHVDAARVANLVEGNDISRLLSTIGDLNIWLELLKENLYEKSEADAKVQA